MTDKAANALASVSGVTTILGFTLAEINELLQAGAFIVAIISGMAATFYYIKKANK
jgi:thiamine monophosphate synthase